MWHDESEGCASGPGSRRHHATVLDISRNRIVLWGGIREEDHDSTPKDNKTWERVSEGKWVQGPQQGPAPRLYPAMAYDSKRKVIVLFGGSTNSSLTNPDCPSDTWEYNGAAWKPVSTSGPSGRYGHAMAFDATRNVVVLHGGKVNGGSISDETWEWDGDRWKQAASGPTLYFHSMVFDTPENALILFGGRMPNSSAPIRGETYLRSAGGQWSNLGENGPSPREEHAMVHDAQARRTYLLGGLTPQAYQKDLWVRQNSSWSQVAAGPSARHGHAMAYDDARGRTVLFGGNEGQLLNPTPKDTWEWDGVQWSLRSSTGPSPREWHAMAYDPARKVTVLFGGQDYDSKNLDDTWEWDGTTWSQAGVTPPPRRYGHAMAYDPLSKGVLLYGGYDTSYFQDTWLYSDSKWTLVAKEGPLGCKFHSMATDRANKRVFLYGGHCNSSAKLYHIWDGSEWKAWPSPPSHIIDENDIITFDSVNNFLVLFRAKDGMSHIFDGSWRQTQGFQPVKRISTTLASDLYGVILFGGTSLDGIDQFDDTTGFAHP
jgi:hypothetical protein